MSVGRQQDWKEPRTVLLKPFSVPKIEVRKVRSQNLVDVSEDGVEPVAMHLNGQIERHLEFLKADRVDAAALRYLNELTKGEDPAFRQAP